MTKQWTEYQVGHIINEALKMIEERLPTVEYLQVIKEVEYDLGIWPSHQVAYGLIMRFDLQDHFLVEDVDAEVGQ